MFFYSRLVICVIPVFGTILLLSDEVASRSTLQNQIKLYSEAANAATAGQRCRAILESCDPKELTSNTNKAIAVQAIQFANYQWHSGESISDE